MGKFQEFGQMADKIFRGNRFAPSPESKHFFGTFFFLWGLFHFCPRTPLKIFGDNVWLIYSFLLEWTIKPKKIRKSRIFGEYFLFFWLLKTKNFSKNSVHFKTILYSYGTLVWLIEKYLPQLDMVILDTWAKLKPWLLVTIQIPHIILTIPEELIQQLVGFWTKTSLPVLEMIR